MTYRCSTWAIGILATIFVVCPRAIAEPKPPILPADAGMPVIDWKDARKFVDRAVIVQGKIAETGQTASICFLNFDAGRTFTAIVRKPHWSKFSQPPGTLYAGKIVRIRGVISEYRGKPQIEVTSPDQIVILEKEEPLSPVAPPVAAPEFKGVVTLATYNVLNLFDEHDDPYHDDEGTPSKPLAEMEKLAATIRALNADVLALQEVENRPYLERFVHALLSDMGYRHIVLFEGNDRRGIDVALLSRLPVGPVTSHRHGEFSDGSGGLTKFRRDLLQVRIEPPGYPSFDVFVVHFKSKRGGGGGESTRLAEAAQSRRALDGLLAADADALFVICGDFNDTWDSPPLKVLRGQGAAALHSFHGDAAQGSVSYNKPPYRSTIDFVFASPAMARRYVEKSYRALDGSIAASGSDHNPVAVQFDLGSAAGEKVAPGAEKKLGPAPASQGP